MNCNWIQTQLRTGAQKQCRSLRDFCGVRLWPPTAADGARREAARARKGKIWEIHGNPILQALQWKTMGTNTSLFFH